MNRRSLRLVEALAQAGHFGRASAILGTAQPHLSSALKALEHELGVRLFERRPNVRLTPQGEIILEAARRAFDDIDQAVDRARLVQAGIAGWVTVGFASTVMFTELAHSVRAFQQSRPEVRLTLIDMHSNPQWDALASGRLDVALTREIKTVGDISCQLIHREPLTLAVPSGHKFAAAERPVEIADLAREAFVLFPESAAPALHAEIFAACAAAGFAPRVVQTVDEWQTVLSFVALGVGLTIGPDCLRAFRFQGVEFRELQGARASADIFICRRRGRISAAAEAFVRFMHGRNA